MRLAALLALPSLFPLSLRAQANTPIAVPITVPERIEWTVDGTIGLRSLGIGVIASAWQTGRNSPEEWQRNWAGFGKRYLEREADVAISNSLEAGVGALWGEDPRYFRSHLRGWARVRYAMKTVLLAPRRDGTLAPAWGRLAGNTVNNVIENAWLPSSATTAGQTTIRSAEGLLGRLIGNMWEEFWPDVETHLSRRRSSSKPSSEPRIVKSPSVSATPPTVSSSLEADEEQ
jgi:hypothetical protein